MKVLRIWFNGFMLTTPPMEELLADKIIGGWAAAIISDVPQRGSDTWLLNTGDGMLDLSEARAIYKDDPPVPEPNPAKDPIQAWMDTFCEIMDRRIKAMEDHTRALRRGDEWRGEQE